MNLQDFFCPECKKSSLNLTESLLVCPTCGATFSFHQDIPFLLPSGELTIDVDGRTFSLSKIQEVYDRVYAYDGLMGTDLDNHYDCETKGILLGFGKPLSGKRLLDVGAGIGKLWDCVPSDVKGYALEPSLMGAIQAHQRHPELTVSVSVGESIPYSNGFFDMVISADTIEHTFSPQQTLADIERVLKPGGILGASFPIADSLRKWGWNQVVRRHFNLVFWARLARVVFTRIMLFGKADFQPIDRDLPISEWKNMIESSGLSILNIIEWPVPPEVPIVYLVHAVKE